MTEPWGFCYCHLGVLTHVFGSFNKPQTLYFGCLAAPQVGSITGMNSGYLFVNMHASSTYLEGF